MCLKNFQQVIGKNRLVLAGIMFVLLNSNVLSDPKPAKKTPIETEHPALDLQLHDDLLNEDENPFQSSQNEQQPEQILTTKGRKRPLNVDCGMDMNPYTPSDAALTQRLSGECDFHYQY